MAGLPGPLDDGYIPTRGPWAYTVEVEGEAVILDEAADRLHLLNPSASLLWACFDGVSTLAEICSDLAVALGAPDDVVVADSRAALERLVAEGLVYDGRDGAPAWSGPATGPSNGEP